VRIVTAMQRLLPLTIVACLGLVACGGDDDKKLSKADLAKKANQICQKARDDSDAIDQPSDLFQNPVAAASYFTKVEPVLKKRTDELAKLKPDDDIKAAWTQFVARQKQAYDVIVTVRDKAKAKDASGVQDLAKASRIDAKLVPEAAAVGATQCARGG
jgi:hypothetical protein